MKDWIKNLKLAIIKEDVESIANLTKNFNASHEKIEEVKALLEEAIKLMCRKKENLALDIKKLQRAKKYMR